jgi:hypothetical protein
MRVATRRLVVLTCSLALLIAGVAVTNAATAAARTPAVPAHLPTLIEPLAGGVTQSSCDPTVKAGTARLMRLLLSTYPHTTTASAYACGTDGRVSEHYEGRAVDWMVSIRNGTQHTYANSLISWLLATDRHGNRDAMARRLGVQYLIFNNRIWQSWNGQWKAYRTCAALPRIVNDNACHRTHMHISLTWNGATGHTSFWTGQRAVTDFGPCRARDLNWAGPRTGARASSCPRYPAVQAAARASATKVALVAYSGAVVRLGSRGPAVAAVQRALHVGADGSFGPKTRAAVIGFQQRHHQAGNGVVGASTWRALLSAVR